MTVGLEKNRSTRHARALLCIAVGGALLAGCAGTGSIQGRVHVPAEPAPATPARPSPSSGAVGASNDATEAVIMAWPEAGAPAAPLVGAGGRVRVVQAGGRFVPRVLVILPGTTVEFANRDHVYHSAFSISPPTPFDVGKYAPGQVRRMRFDQVGVLKVFCELHPSEVIYIVVAPDRWYTRPAADGDFVLLHVPPGTYLVRAWHPALADVTERVEVSAKHSATINFGR